MWVFHKSFVFNLVIVNSSGGNNILNRSSGWIVSFFLGVTVISIVGMCFFAVPSADDLWIAASIKQDGLIGSFFWFISNWTGRVSHLFLVSIYPYFFSNPTQHLAYFGIYVVLLAFMTASILVVTGYSYFRLHMSKGIKEYEKFSLGLFLVALYVALALLSNSVEMYFFWPAGILNYPFARHLLIFIFLNIAVKEKISIWIYLLAFFALTIHEIDALLFGLAIVLFLVNRNTYKKYLPILLSTALCLLIHLLMPGVAMRSSVFKGSGILSNLNIDIISQTFSTVYERIIPGLFTFPVILVSLAFFIFSVNTRSCRKSTDMVHLLKVLIFWLASIFLPIFIILLVKGSGGLRPRTIDHSVFYNMIVWLYLVHRFALAVDTKVFPHYYLASSRFLLVFSLLQTPNWYRMFSSFPKAHSLAATYQLRNECLQEWAKKHSTAYIRPILRKPSFFESSPANVAYSRHPLAQAYPKFYGLDKIDVNKGWVNSTCERLGAPDVKVSKFWRRELYLPR